MRLRRIEQAFVLAVGFVLGAGLSVCIAPGDVFLWVLVGIILGLFCRAHFLQDWSGEFFGWFPHHHHPPLKAPSDLGGRTR